MKNKNLIFICLGIISVGLIILIIGNNLEYKTNPKEVVQEQENERKVYSTGISMMLETSAGSGEYVETTDTTWAQAIAKGYIFNETMSKCENGSTLTWNETNKTVEFTGNVSDRCYVYFDLDPYVYPSVDALSQSNQTSSSFKVTATATKGQSDISTYHFASVVESASCPTVGNSAYVSQSGTEKEFTGLAKNATYKICAYVTDTNGKTSKVMNQNFATKDVELIANVINNLYTSDGANGLYYHDGQGTYGEYEAGDNSYRFAGANPNNYVCFGTAEATCPTDNLYRIIGTFDGQMKLIKYDYATSNQLGTNGAYYTTRNPGVSYKGKLTSISWYDWNSSSSNIWSESNLYTTNLNTNFKNYLQTAGGKDWTQYIDGNKIWKAGGNTSAKIKDEVNARTVYANEITGPADSATVTAMFGLMYVSDYMYAADPTQANAWRAVKTNNWMYMGMADWTISRLSDKTNYVFFVDDTGSVRGSSVGNSNSVRPVFYLKSTVELKSGSGTQSDPYRIA